MSPGLTASALFCCGIIAGAFISLVGAPAVKEIAGCSTYKVNTKTAISYALRPPEALPKACPEAPRCDVLKKEENLNTSEDDVKKTEEIEQPRRRRHHRYRRYRR